MLFELIILNLLYIKDDIFLAFHFAIKIIQPIYVFFCINDDEMKDGSQV